MNRRHFVAAALAAALAGTFSPLARSEPPVSDLMPADVKWKDSPFPGVQTAVISGDPTQAGLYVVRAKYAAGGKVMPHTHPDTRYDTVLSGELYFGFGETFDPSNSEALSGGRADHGAREHAAFRVGARVARPSCRRWGSVRPGPQPTRNRGLSFGRGSGVDPMLRPALPVPLR